MNDYNLIPNSRRSPSELREMGRKGGIKSGESRRRKRDLKKRLAMWQKVFEDIERQQERSDDKARAKRRNLNHE